MNYTVISSEELKQGLHKCSTKVSAGASMIRGLQNQRPCESSVVFGIKDETGRCTYYCARHANMDKPPGYTAPVKEERYTFVVHYTKDNAKSWQFVYGAKNERGARMSFARQPWNKDSVIDRIFVKPADQRIDHKTGELVFDNEA